MPLKSYPGSLVYDGETYPDPGARKQEEFISLFSTLIFPPNKKTCDLNTILNNSYFHVIISKWSYNVIKTSCSYLIADLERTVLPGLELLQSGSVLLYFVISLR